MIIEGELALKHEGHHSVNLKPFEQDSFSGEWITRSIGKVRDFNLMLDDGCQGELKSIHLKNGMSSKIINEISSWIGNYTNLTQAFYCIIGSTNIVINNTEKISLYEGDLLLINIDNREISINIEINNIAEQCTNIIMSSILY